jgi:excisionase family DNA binding protein
LSQQRTIAQAAGAAGCSPDTVRRAIRSDELPAALVDGRYAITQDDLEAWVTSRLVLRTTRASGVPLTVEDADVLRKIAAIVENAARSHAAIAG